jgi:hypothetical protein
MRLWSKVAIAIGAAGAVALTIWLASAPGTVTTPVDRGARAVPDRPDVARTSLPKRATTLSEPAAVRPNASTVVVPSYLVTQPKLADRVQPLLQRGADVELAAQGFASAEMFAAVAHAAHNLDVPFVVLKHRVLNERLTLSKAIAATRPDVKANEEASRAVAAARADVFESKRVGS